MRAPIVGPAIKPIHPWLRKIGVSFIPGPGADELADVVTRLLAEFELHGHWVQPLPDDQTDVILTTARWGETVNWREAALFSARRRFQLNRTPTVYTLVKITRAQMQTTLDTFAQILTQEPPDPAAYDFPGLSPTAYRVLFEQGKRGGPMLSLERLIQAQAKSIRVLLVVGEAEPEAVYHLDLVGAFPKSEASDRESLYADVVLRIVTTLSTREVTQHLAVGEAVPQAVWKGLTTPSAMKRAGGELGQRNFFTEMVTISNLVSVPAVTAGVANQYSEGCFSTWDPVLGALIATVTGSARPVYKGGITEDDLAVIVGVREGGIGALVRHVEGKRNDPPSTEAVEMMLMDAHLPRVPLDAGFGATGQAPVVRSKLHGHRGISAYAPNRVEYLPLDPPYYHYPVSCATEAQAHGIETAFARSEALQNPDDPRQVAFTVLPGHGVVIAEKWTANKAPFQLMWEYMDAGWLQVSSRIPQGAMSYESGSNELMILKE